MDQRKQNLWLLKAIPAVLLLLVGIGFLIAAAIAKDWATAAWGCVFAAGFFLVGSLPMGTAPWKN